MRRAGPGRHTAPGRLARRARRGLRRALLVLLLAGLAAFLGDAGTLHAAPAGGGAVAVQAAPTGPATPSAARAGDACHGGHGRSHVGCGSPVFMARLWAPALPRPRAPFPPPSARRLAGAALAHHFRPPIVSFV